MPVIKLTSPAPDSGRSNVLKSLGDALEKATRRGTRAALCCAAGDHDRSGPHVVLFVDAQLTNFGTVNPTGTKMSLDAVIMCFVTFTGALLAAYASRPSSAREMPASAMHRPIKTRRLKKADFEADFFFMECLWYRMEL